MADRNERLHETASQTAGPYVHIGLMPNSCGIPGIFPTDLGSTLIDATHFKGAVLHLNDGALAGQEREISTFSVSSGVGVFEMARGIHDDFGHRTMHDGSRAFAFLQIRHDLVDAPCAEARLRRGQIDGGPLPILPRVDFVVEGAAGQRQFPALGAEEVAR